MLQKIENPLISFEYKDEWGTKTSGNSELVFGDDMPPLICLFDAFARFLVMAGYSPENVREYYSDF